MLLVEAGRQIEADDRRNLIYPLETHADGWTQLTILRGEASPSACARKSPAQSAFGQTGH
jgi:hypothetical protein